MANDAEVSGALESRLDMAAEHAERADRAQRLSDRAREQAGLERAAAERSERLIDGHGDPGLADIHRQVAALHRQAERHYARASESGSVSTRPMSARRPKGDDPGPIPTRAPARLIGAMSLPTSASTKRTCASTRQMTASALPKNGRA